MGKRGLTMNEQSKTFSDRDRAHHIHSFTNLSEHVRRSSLVIDRGEGVYLFDLDGRRYLDAMSSLWCVTLGYSEPRLIRAATEQLQCLPYSHTFRGRSHPKLIELAEKIVKLTPDHMTHVFFAGSGSEANESAIKMAWSYHKAKGQPKRRKIISRENAYHGSTIFATQLSGMPSMHRYQSIDTPEVLYAECPNFLTNAHPGESEEEFATRLAKKLEALVLSEGPDTIAALIAEPVMGVGGVILPPTGYFEKVQAILRRHGVLMIADEVICGFGRTGNLFGSITFEIKPDILTVGKGVSSAYSPLSATIVAEHVHDALVALTGNTGVFSHGFTYSGHPVSAAVALEALHILEERDIVGHVRSVTERFQRRLRQLQQNPHVTRARGVGLMGAFDIVRAKGRNESFDLSQARGNALMDRAEENGLFIRAVGDTIVVAPPLVISEAEIDTLFNRLRASLDVLH